jgi:hypothetical protein
MELELGEGPDEGRIVAAEVTGDPANRRAAETTSLARSDTSHARDGAASNW